MRGPLYANHTAHLPMPSLPFAAAASGDNWRWQLMHHACPICHLQTLRAVWLTNNVPTDSLVVLQVPVCSNLSVFIETTASIASIESFYGHWKAVGKESREQDADSVSQKRTVPRLNPIVILRIILPV